MLFIEDSPLSCASNSPAKHEKKYRGEASSASLDSTMSEMVPIFSSKEISQRGTRGVPLTMVLDDFCEGKSQNHIWMMMSHGV